MKSTVLAAIAAALFSASSVSAHGGITAAVLDGYEYKDYAIWGRGDEKEEHPQANVFRKFKDGNPLKDLASPVIQCGGSNDKYSDAARLSAPVTAGRGQEIHWDGWPDSHLGPVITYMADCEGDCSDFTPGNKRVWFKIKEGGKDGNGKWPDVEKLIRKEPYKFSFPKNLRPGEYLVRHEILALHPATKYPGVETYPHCFQVSLNSTGEKTAPYHDLVAFPGAYDEYTPGIIWALWNETLQKEEYTIPGPRLWTGEEEQ